MKEYDSIAKYCYKYLSKSLHDNHLSDLIQFVALKHWETDGKKKWEWSCSDYCRINGLNSISKSKKAAHLFTNSISVDSFGTTDLESEPYYLFNAESINQSNQFINKRYEQDNALGVLEEFLIPLNLKKEVMEWVLKNYKQKTR